MNSLRIPDLNLFRGKRSNRQNETDRIQKKSWNMIGKGNNKELLQKMQVELYVDNYTSNLKHFVSPTKYKDKALKYLTNSKGSDQFYLKSIQLPKSKRYCMNCFDKYLKAGKRSCCCETELKVPKINRQQVPKAYNFQGNKYSVVNENKQIKREGKKIQMEQVKEQQAQRQEFISRDFILSESQVPQKEQKEQIQQQQQYIAHRENRSIFHTINNRIIPDSSYFTQSIRKREEYLQHLDMNIDDSQQLHVDFTSLNEAKRQYVNKSNQILDLLDQIIRSHSP